MSSHKRRSWKPRRRCACSCALRAPPYSGSWWFSSSCGARLSAALLLFCPTIIILYANSMVTSSCAPVLPFLPPFMPQTCRTYVLFPPFDWIYARPMMADVGLFRLPTNFDCAALKNSAVGRIAPRHDAKSVSLRLAISSCVPAFDSAASTDSYLKENSRLWLVLIAPHCAAPYSTASPYRLEREYPDDHYVRNIMVLRLSPTTDHAKHLSHHFVRRHAVDCFGRLRGSYMCDDARPSFECGISSVLRIAGGITCLLSTL